MISKSKSSTPKSGGGVKDEWIRVKDDFIVHFSDKGQENLQDAPNFDGEFFHSQVKLLDQDDDLLKRLPSQILERSIFLPAKLMSILDWTKLGKLVRVSGVGVFYAWPIECTTTSVLTTSNLFTENESIQISSFDETVEIAHVTLIKVLSPPHFEGKDSPTFRSLLRHYLIDRIVTVPDSFQFVYYGKTIRLQISEIKVVDQQLLESQLVKLVLRMSSDQYAKIVPETLLKLESDEEEEGEEEETLYQRLGGLDDVIGSVEVALKNYMNGGGILLYGASGTGKTTIGRNVGSLLGRGTLVLNGPDIYSKYYGETELKLDSIFKQAAQSQSLLFMDELDSLCPGGGKTDQERRILAAIIKLMDSFRDQVIVIAASSHIDDIDESLRRPGRFDYEIEIPVPSPSQRNHILQKLFSNIKKHPPPSSLGIQEIAEITHGFVGADLEALVAEISSSSSLQTAMKKIKPSAMREVMVQVPSVSWNDIGGMDELKLKLKQAVEWPLKNPQAFQRLAITPPKGVLMYGPPGCSKTMIAKALANESGLNFMAVKGPELFSKWVGESERTLRKLFQKARRVAPAIVFFDEIDALGAERLNSSNKVGDRLLAQLLTEIDGVEALKSVTILAATNRPDMIDKALLRPGRLDRLIYVPLPDKLTRRRILEIQKYKMPINCDTESLADKLKGYSGAEIVALCNEAALKALEENVEAETINQKHFQDATSLIKPRINHHLLEVYEKFGQTE